MNTKERSAGFSGYPLIDKMDHHDLSKYCLGELISASDQLWELYESRSLSKSGDAVARKLFRAISEEVNSRVGRILVKDLKR